MMAPSIPSAISGGLLLLTHLVAVVAGYQSHFYPGPGFDVRESSIDSIHEALFAGTASCRDVVSAFIVRTEEFNPAINAVIALNPHVLDDADALDARIATGNATGSLFCVPMLLKDNFDAVGMPTTGGCRALAHIEPEVDGPVVAALKDAGAVVLGKVNMHEMALEGLSVSSLGGQTRNPYDLARTPGGSSGGTGAAIAASLAVLGTGTDTVNSMRSPASANNLFSFRPTRGLVSRWGLIPVGYTQDTVGAMGRGVRDIATALTVMSSIGHDPRDNVTALIPNDVLGKDYTAALSRGSLRGKRFGILSGFYNFTGSDETTPVIEAMADMEKTLIQAGAELINITNPIFNITSLAPEVDVQTFEYREMLNEYLQRHDLKGQPRPTSFEQIYKSNDYLVIPHQYDYIKLASTRSTSDPLYKTKQQGILDLTATLHAEFHRRNLDAIIYPEQKNLVVRIGAPSQAGRNGILAAVTGSPVVVVPAGWSGPSREAPLGVPIGMEILGLPWTEDKLLNVAQLISDLVPARKMPESTGRSVGGKSYQCVHVIRPNAGDIPLEYPLGTIIS